MKYLRFLPLPILIIVATLTITADEGMYPLSEIGKLDLASKGLEIDIEEIYNPDGVSLVDAICEVGRGTGEFVSPDGLILTNHHIAFSAVVSASTAERDYLKEGFVAPTKAEELPAEGYVCRINEDYRDVSDEILEGITRDTPPAERNKLIRERMRTLAEKERGDRENITCEVSEMFPGKTYVLFTYRLILDVRMVYVPPLAIGEFGGEFDNWIWPRHTGDFSFLRAYVAPDGSTAPYSKDNVPFKPKKHLEVNPKGVSEDDFVMILGYPGRTYRHKTSHFLELQEERYLSYIAEIFDWLIDYLEEAGEEDRELQLRYANDIKSYANVTKNFKGKMQGLRRLDLVEKRMAEERELQEYINSDSELRQKYSGVLKEIDELYDRQMETIKTELTSRLLMRASRASGLAGMAIRTNAMSNDDAQRKERVVKSLQAQLQEIETDVEKDILAYFFTLAAELPEGQRIDAIDKIIGNATDADEAEKQAYAWLDGAFKSPVFTESGLASYAMMPSDEFAGLDDPMITFIRDLQKEWDAGETAREERSGTLNRLEAELLDAKMAWKKASFIPDANSTLRLTYGYVRGYSPSDATYYSPLTSLRGVVEKHTGERPFIVPEKLRELYRTKNYNKEFEDEELEDVPVALLYNMDTTGGNSGSPIMDAYGRLVGVNFDRAYEATINDYEWSESYSRSIGVDIRYVLFIAKYLGGADFLLEELGVNM
ncbi:MAG: dipeptidyl-peptidase 7 [Ectothiorhodospiraceae bacterium]|nr:dipeptidyl-peptidase 7 [Ectothiorhodospiraceae bacterium]